MQISRLANVWRGALDRLMPCFATQDSLFDKMSQKSIAITRVDGACFISTIIHNSKPSSLFASIPGPRWAHPWRQC
ncbi:putative membrane protein [Fusarium oxysporum f. sp. albedinis]|nr:putative membrane protein [Fusarium oxysporum f. sp. albedinis]